MAKILLVEDNTLNRQMLSRRLERKGYQVVEAADGGEGVAKARSERPDLILMDMSMPVLDGWSATRQLKASPDTRSIPVIALTAHAMVGDYEKAIAAGCDFYETKPVDIVSLLAKMEKLLSTEQPAVAAEPSEVRHLLIVDDNEINRDVLSRRLVRQQYRVTMAKTGPEALELIGREQFDLVLLDVMMPGMSGLEVLRVVRERYSILDLPVIMATAKDQSDDVVTALQLGANDYVTKPLNFPVVLARIQTQLSIRQAHRSARPAAVAPRVTAPRPEVARALAGAGVSRDGVPSRTAPPRLPGEPRNPNPTPPPRDPLTATWVESNTSLDWPRLAGYEVLSELGRGGMGVVYKAKHTKMNRLVALKVIDKQHLSNTLAIERFYREIQAAATLAHPNIVLAYDAGQFGETHYFAMEYVEGVDLNQLVAKSGPMSVDEACSYVRQAARGLHHAFERGLVHRDIKPSNLLVTWVPTASAPQSSTAALGRATVKILDMGLALLHQPTEHLEVAGGLTRDGRVVGTADYMAPEQWMNAHKVDGRADLYSLGCTFYFLLTGRVPFPGDEPMEKMLKHHLDEPEAVERLRPEVPANVAVVVRKLLAKKPEHRYQQPGDVAEALRDR